RTATPSTLFERPSPWRSGNATSERHNVTGRREPGQDPGTRLVKTRAMPRLWAAKPPVVVGCWSAAQAV
ncbi:MAG: hypothetical protein J2O47_00600, partial [Acidimicrobiaceae bacterium]|nr:hypothetical protein [Acidimicrobiaceae bacterium]